MFGRRARISSCLLLACFLLEARLGPPGALAAVTPGSSPTPLNEVPDGTMLSKDNWQIAQGYLPDERKVVGY